MYLKQADLFWGLSQQFIQALTSEATKQTFRSGDIVFRSDDPAENFYVLIQGRIRLEIGKAGRGVYVSDRTGEVIGWSTLIGREKYSATCICEQATVLLMFEKGHISRLLERDAESASIFFKHLAAALGDRLLKLYQLIEQ
jgi:CRP/FNR family cyclic AMP-dependent transcriptional regulator